MDSLQLTGDVAERQTYLNGTRYFLIEAQAATGGAVSGPSCTLAFTLPKEPAEPVTEGDFAYEDNGAEWYGSVAGGTYSEASDPEYSRAGRHRVLRFVCG